MLVVAPTTIGMEEQREAEEEKVKEKMCVWIGFGLIGVGRRSS